MAINRLRATPILCTAFAATAGFYLLASLSRSTTAVFLILAVIAFNFFLILSSLDKQSRILRHAVICAAVFAAGLALGLSAANAGRTETTFALSADKIIAIEGKLTEDPRLIISGGRALVPLSLRRCAGEGGMRTSARGEITVFFPQESAEKIRELGRGTSVFCEGRLRNSETGWTFSAASMHVVKRAPAIEKIRTGARLSMINRFSGSNWSGLALALLLGIRDNLDTDLASMYRDAGCSYILALSGMHLAVLAALISFLLKKPLGLKGAAIAGAAIIILYCLFVGPMPSLYRAGLMYLLGAAAIIGFLPREPVSILSLSFLIQIILFPASGYSISFILSYLALFGILILSPPIYSIFSGKVPDFLLMPLSASCGAFLATAGITGFSFGVLAPVGIIAGLALVPLTTVFMIGSLVWFVFDLFSISGFISIPLSLIYQLMEKIVTVASSIPRISAVNPYAILVISVILSIFIVIFEYRQQEFRLKLQPFLL